MTIDIDERIQIENLIHHFHRLVDDGRAAETVECFSDDCRIIFGDGAPTPGLIEGEGVRTLMENRQKEAQTRTRHLISNLSFGDAEIAEAGIVIATYNILLFKTVSEDQADPTRAIADVKETFIRIGATWKIKDRYISPVFI